MNIFINQVREINITTKYFRMWPLFPKMNDSADLRNEQRYRCWNRQTGTSPEANKKANCIEPLIRHSLDWSWCATYNAWTRNDSLSFESTSQMWCRNRCLLLGALAMFSCQCCCCDLRMVGTHLFYLIVYLLVLSITLRTPKSTIELMSFYENKRTQTNKIKM